MRIFSHKKLPLNFIYVCVNTRIVYVNIFRAGAYEKIYFPYDERRDGDFFPRRTRREFRFKFVNSWFRPRLGCKVRPWHSSYYFTGKIAYFPTVPCIFHLGHFNHIAVSANRRRIRASYQYVDIYITRVGGLWPGLVSTVLLDIDPDVTALGSRV